MSLNTIAKYRNLHPIEIITVVDNSHIPHLYIKNIRNSVIVIQKGWSTISLPFQNNMFVYDNIKYLIENNEIYAFKFSNGRCFKVLETDFKEI